MKRNFVLLSSVFILLALILVIAGEQLTVTVNSPVANQNISGTFLLNATVGNATGGNATNVTWSFWNGSNGFTETNFTNLTGGGGSNFSWLYPANTLTLNDGVYNLTVYAVNNTGQINASVNITDVRIDNSAPLVVINYPIDGESFNATNESTILNATITDSVTNIMVVTLNVSNRSGQVILSPATVAGSEYRNTTFNLSVLAEGAYNFTVIANNSAARFNRSVSSQFFIDIANPYFVTFSCSDATLGNDPTCTCTAADNTDGNVTTSVSGHIDVGSTGGHTATCVATDDMGRTNSTTAGFTINAAASSSSGSSGGGGGGATVSNYASKTVVHTFAHVAAGETVTMQSTDASVAVSSVAITSNAEIYGVRMVVGSYGSKRPLGTPALEGTAYQYLEITKSGSNPDAVTNAKIKFSVPNSWVDSNGVMPRGVVLYRYVGQKWVALQTTYLGTGHTAQGEVHLYDAQTPGFSFFAIGGTKGSSAPTTSTTPTPVSAPSKPVVAQSGQEEDVVANSGSGSREAAPVADAQEAPAQVEEESSSWGWIAAVVVVLVIIVVIFFTSGSSSTKKTSKK
ncbi:PGF-pre-PGF domain-containing protein [Candidatus Woesearchaeota archaeon]|nr:PGF-pre-PGF domain-containing protein [Candidatus Woesearchaeota archaeon]